MKVYPAIDIRRGRVVQLVGGDPKAVAVDLPDVAEQAELWREAGAKRLHVVDLDAAFGEARQWGHLGKTIASGLPVQFGGGVRSMTQIQQLLELGVDRVVVGTQGVQNPLWARELCKVFPGRIVLAVDGHGRDVRVKGWTEAPGLDAVALARDLDDAGLAAFLYTNVAKEGRLGGIDEAVVSDLRGAAQQTELIVSGGVRDMADLDRIDSLGADGVVLGMAIYAGRLDLAEAVRRFDGVPA